MREGIEDVGVSLPWGWRDLAAVVVLFCAGAAAIILGLRSLLAGTGSDAGTTSPAVYGATVAIYGLLLTAIYLVVARRSGWYALGIRPASWQAFAVTPLLLFAGFAGVIVINLTIALVRGGFENPQVEALSGGEPFSTPELLQMLVLVAVLVPIAEELFFRGMLYPLLRRQWGVSVAIVGSALLFAAAHFILLLVPALFLIGLLLGLLRERSGSVLPCILFHALQNGTALLVINAILSQPALAPPS